MSFATTKSIVEEGDTVIIYVNPQTMYAIQVRPTIASKTGEMVENVFQTNYGALKVIELIGKKYGHKIQFSRGWGWLLHPTPELWTLTLPHRTQILYTPDISVIVQQLELKSGSIVVESGNYNILDYVLRNHSEIILLLKSILFLIQALAVVHSLMQVSEQ